jgi:phosphatidylglycerol:prolipoprotein diacylglycerol transferase
MFPVLFKIGFFELRVYSLMYILGLVMTIFFVSRRSRKFGIPKEQMENIIIFTFLGGLIGARAYYVILNWSGYFSSNPMEIFAIWHGGLAIHGGLIGGLVTVFIYTRYKSISPFAIGDLTLPFVLLSQGLGRFGNFANGEVHGVPVFTPFSIIFDLKKAHFGQFWHTVLDKFNVHNDPVSLTNFYNMLKAKGELAVTYAGKEYILRDYVPWGISFNAKYMPPAYREFGSIPLHPTFFYESILNFLFGAFLVWLWRKDEQIGLGFISGMYFIFYAVIRSFVTFFRAEDLMVGSLRAPHLASIGLVIVGSILIYISRRKRAAS